MSLKSIAGVVVLVLVPMRGLAQDPTGAIEGVVTDKTAGVVAGAHVVARNLDTGFTREAHASADGLFRLPLLPVGQYSMTVEATDFGKLVQQPIQVNVSQTVRLDPQLEVASRRETVTVTSQAPLVDASTNTLGKVVSGREIVDLPTAGHVSPSIYRTCGLVTLDERAEIAN